MGSAQGKMLELSMGSTGTPIGQRDLGCSRDLRSSPPDLELSLETPSESCVWLPWTWAWPHRGSQSPP